MSATVVTIAALKEERELGDIVRRMFDPTMSFPRDQMVNHLDNIGDTLQTSGYLLDQYLDAADAIVEKTFTSFVRLPEQKWSFKGPFKQRPELDSAHKEAYNQAYLSLYETTN